MDAGALLALERSARSRVDRADLTVRPPRPQVRRSAGAGRTQALGTPPPAYPTRALAAAVPGDHARATDDDLDDTGDDHDDHGDDLDEDDPLAPVADELAHWGRRRRQRGFAGLLLVLVAAVSLGVLAWTLATRTG